MPLNVPPFAVISIVGWLLSGFVPAWIPAALIVFLGTGVVKPLGGVRTPAGTDIQWGFWDYVGIAFVLAVIAALVQGTTGASVISTILGHAPKPPP